MSLFGRISSFLFRFVSPDIEGIVRNLDSTPAWMPTVMEANMDGLGRRIAYIMRMQLRSTRVTGELEESIVSNYIGGQTNAVRIGPTRKYSGGWDAGLIMQLGTRPIGNVPFAPIKAWAEFRGLPAGPIWMKIRKEGIAPHPFLQETLDRGDTQAAIRATARRMAQTITSRALTRQHNAAISLASLVFGGEPE